MWFYLNSRFKNIGIKIDYSFNYHCYIIPCNFKYKYLNLKKKDKGWDDNMKNWYIDFQFRWLIINFEIHIYK